MKKLLWLAPVLFLLIACNKSKFQTKPQIEIKSVNTDVEPINGNFMITLSFTDKEGDVCDTLSIKKYRLNKTVTATIRDSLFYKIPDFPEHSTGDININLDYQTILSAINPPPIVGSNPPKNQPDTLTVKFAVQDKAGNTSDTISTKVIVIR